MDYDAIEWSLSGNDGRRSLMREHPLVFIPVALDLAEALSFAHIRNHNEDMERFAELADALWSQMGVPKDQEAETFAGPDPLRDLVDDKPDWYWQSAGHDLYHRLLSGVQDGLVDVSVAVRVRVVYDTCVGSNL